jgi:hypothetical protein
MWIYTSTPPYAFMTLRTGPSLPSVKPGNIISLSSAVYLACQKQINNFCALVFIKPISNLHHLLLNPFAG